MSAYRTLLKPAETESIVRKSRFIGKAAPAANTDDALAILEELKKEHRTASHHCYAYVIGRNKGIIRYSDDGEPSGTAGKPIVETLMAKDVVDCVVVVTRYFGGVLLGAGGLTRAYAHAAAAALDAAGVCEMHETVRWRFDAAYPLWDRVDYMMKSLPIIAEDTEYAASVKGSILCRLADEDIVIQELLKITDGKIISEREEETFFYPWEE